MLTFGCLPFEISHSMTTCLSFFPEDAGSSTSSWIGKLPVSHSSVLVVMGLVPPGVASIAYPSHSFAQSAANQHTRPVPFIESNSGWKHFSSHPGLRVLVYRFTWDMVGTNAPHQHIYMTQTMAALVVRNGWMMNLISLHPHSI